MKNKRKINDRKDIIAKFIYISLFILFFIFCLCFFIPLIILFIDNQANIFGEENTIRIVILIVFFYSLLLGLFYVILDLLDVFCTIKCVKTFNVFLKKDEYKECILYFEKKVNKSFIYTHRNWFNYFAGLGYFCSSDNEEAKKYFHKVIKYRPFQDQLFLNSLFYLWVLSIAENNKYDEEKICDTVDFFSKKYKHFKRFKNQRVIRLIESLSNRNYEDTYKDEVCLKNKTFKEYVKKNV